MKGNRSHVVWSCACDCGGKHEVIGRLLVKGDVTSCGCRGQETRLKPTHGKSRTRVYRIWKGMHARCADPNAAYWGARGITVCERWGSFEAFLEDMGEPPTDTHEIDRKDGSLGYSRSNCRWATPQEQAVNRSTSLMLTAGGETLHLAAWADRTGLTRGTIVRRIKKGLTVEEALFTPRRCGPCHSTAAPRRKP
jgi:hypothetical protein